MGNVFTLDSLREEAERKFAPVVVTLSDGTDVTLRNLLRLGKKERTTVVEKLKELEGNDESDQDGVERLLEVSTAILLIVADRGQALIDEIGGDVPVVMQVLEVWMESTQPGEAKSSPA